MPVIQGLALVPRTPGRAGTAHAAAPHLPPHKLHPTGKGLSGWWEGARHTGGAWRRLQGQHRLPSFTHMSGAEPRALPGPPCWGVSSSSSPTGTSRGCHSQHPGSPWLKYQVSSCCDNTAGDPSPSTWLTKFHLPLYPGHEHNSPLLISNRSHNSPLLISNRSI